MSLNKPTSWLQAAVVATSMLLPGACSKAENAPLELDGFTPKECQEEVLPEEALEFLHEIATRIRILCPEGFEENGYPCSRIDGDGSTTLKYSSQSGRQTTQHSISVIGGRKDDDAMRIRANYFTFCDGVIGEGSKNPEKSTLHDEDSIDLQGGWETIQNGETLLNGEISHEAKITIEPLNKDAGTISVISLSALSAEPATLTQKEVVKTLQQNRLPTHLNE